MTTLQIVGLLIAGVVLAFPTAILLSVAGGWLVSRRRETCLACSRRALRCVQWIRATVLIEGRRAPDSWSYYLCESCGAHYKLHRGSWSLAPDEEWAQHCSARA